jgi:hypothetical protein
MGSGKRCERGGEWKERGDACTVGEWRMRGEGGGEAYAVSGGGGGACEPARCGR